MIGKALKKNDLGVISFNGKIDKKKFIIVPNVGAVAREMTGGSQIMMILNRFGSLSLKNKIVLVLNNVVFLPKLIRMDYAVGIKLLCELEILKGEEQGGERKTFILHSQMVDMAMALDNKKVIDYFLLLSKKYKFIPGLMTNNLSFFIRFISFIKNLPANLTVFTNIDDQIESVVNYLKISHIEFNNVYE
jgi:hypothetical protein